MGGRRGLPPARARETSLGLFAADRIGTFRYTLPAVPSARYKVKLYFREPWFGQEFGVPGGPGSRMFNVSSERRAAADALRHSRRGPCGAGGQNFRPRPCDFHRRGGALVHSGAELPACERDRADSRKLIRYRRHAQRFTCCREPTPGESSGGCGCTVDFLHQPKVGLVPPPTSIAASKARPSTAPIFALG